MKAPFWVRRTNPVGNIFALGLRGQWHIRWNAGYGGYKIHTYKTVNRAKAAADALAKEHPGDTVSVLDYDNHIVETYGYPKETK